jgi:hypothetical protein
MVGHPEVTIVLTVRVGVNHVVISGLPVIRKHPRIEYVEGKVFHECTNAQDEFKRDA